MKSTKQEQIAERIRSHREKVRKAKEEEEARRKQDEAKRREQERLAAIPQQGNIQVFVKTLTGKTITIDVDPSERIKTIKQRIKEKGGIPPDQQRLVFAGQQVCSTRVVCTYPTCTYTSLVY